MTRPMESFPSSAPLDRDFQQWEEELQNPDHDPNSQQGTVESSDFQPYSPTAERVRNAAEKIATFIENSGDMREKAKERIVATGKSALLVVETITSRTVTSVAEAAKGGYQAARTKVIAWAQAAKVRRAEREAYVEKDERELQEQKDQAHEEALAVNEQKKASQEAALDSYAENVTFTEERKEREAATAREAAEVRAREARERKEARKAKRREIVSKAGEKTSELLGKAKGVAGKVGRVALKFLKRGGKALVAGAKAAGSAAKQSWEASR